MDAYLPTPEPSEKRASLSLLPLKGGFYIYIFAIDKDGKRSFARTNADYYDIANRDKHLEMEYYDSLEDAKESPFITFFHKANVLLDAAGEDVSL